MTINLRLNKLEREGR